LLILAFGVGTSFCSGLGTFTCKVQVVQVDSLKFDLDKSQKVIKYLVRTKL